MVLLQPAERLEQTIIAITRDRLRLTLPTRFELTTRDPRPLTPTAPTTTATEHRLWIDHRLRDRLIVR